MILKEFVADSELSQRISRNSKYLSCIWLNYFLNFSRSIASFLIVNRVSILVCILQL